MCWVWLVLAILLEVAATVFMKLSDGFTKMAPTLLMTLLYGLSFIPLALALKRMEIGTAYAVWSALGTVLVTAAGVVLFKESISPQKVASIGVIIIGVVFLSLTTNTEKRQPREAENRVSGPEPGGSAAANRSAWNAGVTEAAAAKQPTTDATSHP